MNTALTAAKINNKQEQDDTQSCQLHTFLSFSCILFLRGSSGRYTSICHKNESKKRNIGNLETTCGNKKVSP
jgi:hypothetical protein